MKSNKDKGKRFIELVEKRKRLKGTRIADILYRLETSLLIVDGNYWELYHAIDNYEKDLSIWDVEKKPEFYELLREFQRLFHNYLSSIYSLIEHTGTVLRDLNHPELNEEHPLKREALLKNDCVWFVKDLRRYYQHIRLPIFSGQLHIEGASQETGGVKISQKILLDKKELLKWGKNWRPKSKRYINSHDEINLKEVLSEYQALNQGFYIWFYKRAQKLHKKELEELMRLEMEMSQLT